MACVAPNEGSRVRPAESVSAGDLPAGVCSVRGDIALPTSPDVHRDRQIWEEVDICSLALLFRVMGQVEKGDSNVKTTRRLHSSEWFGIAQGGTGGFCLLGVWFWATMW